MKCKCTCAAAAGALTVTLGKVGWRVQVCSAHVVAMALRSNAPLLNALFTWRHAGLRPIDRRHHWRVLINNAAQWTP